MIRTVADNTPNPVLTALYSRRDNARAAAKRIFREDEFRIEPAEGGKFRVVLAGEGKPASGKPAIDPGGVIAAIKDECGEVTVDSRTILPKTASEKAAEKRVRMRVIAGGKPKAEDAAGAACLRARSRTSSTPMICRRRERASNCSPCRREWGRRLANCLRTKARPPGPLRRALTAFHRPKPVRPLLTRRSRLRLSAVRPCAGRWAN